jgi:hypothetical protein
MNLPKIGQSIIVRKANGYLPTHLKNSVQIVTDTETDAPIAEEGSGSPSGRGPVVRFQPTEGGTYYTSEWDIVPKVGDRVIAITVPGASYYDGKECTVTEVNPTDTGVIIRGEFPSMQKPDDTLLFGLSQWTPTSSPEVKPSEEVGIITDLQAQVDRFTDQNRILLAKVANWEQDWDTITGALHNEADRRGWCNEYDEFVNEIESELRIGVIPKREREYAVTWTTTVLVSVEVSRNYTAASPEEAEQMAKDDYYAEPETQDIINAVNSGDWEESDDSYREYEVEEV